MATATEITQQIHQDALESYLISMARTVSMSVTRALTALGRSGESGVDQAVGEVFLLEPRINEMEIIIDDRAVRLLRQGRPTEAEIRQTVATLKITNDLERMASKLALITSRRVRLQATTPPGQSDQHRSLERSLRATPEFMDSQPGCNRIVTTFDNTLR